MGAHKAGRKESKRKARASSENIKQEMESHAWCGEVSAEALTRLVFPRA